MRSLGPGPQIKRVLHDELAGAGYREVATAAYKLEMQSQRVLNVVSVPSIAPIKFCCLGDWGLMVGLSHMEKKSNWLDGYYEALDFFYAEPQHIHPKTPTTAEVKKLERHGFDSGKPRADCRRRVRRRKPRSRKRFGFERAYGAALLGRTTLVILSKSSWKCCKRIRIRSATKSRTLGSWLRVRFKERCFSLDGPWYRAF
jgi:hypothetical protein